MVLSVFGGLKGMLWALSLESLLPYLKELQYDAVVYQRTLTIALVPWGLKGFFGTMSDCLPILGYHKRYYMFVANVVGISSVCWLLMMPPSMAQGSIVALAIPFFGIHVQIATIDLLCEGVYSQFIRNNPPIGPKLIAFVNFCTSAGSLLGRTIVGPVSDTYGASPLFCVCLPLALQSLFPVLMNFIGEEKLEMRGMCSQRGTHLQGSQGVFTVALLASACTCGVVVLTLTNQAHYSLPYALLVLILLSGSCFWLLPRRLAQCTIYFFVDALLHLSIQGAVNFFYTADAACVPDGPHFDYTYFSTYTAIAGTAASWFGIWAFQRWFKSWSCRSIFWLTNAIRVLDSLFDFVMVQRLNVALGIPDKLMYMLGDAIAYHCIMSLTHMAGVITVSRMCPAKLESTVYAIMSGISNLGWNLSKLLGARAIEASGISTVVTAEGGCNFSNLSALILFSHFFLPLLTIPLAYFMLPAESLDAPSLASQHSELELRAVKGMRVLRVSTDAEADEREYAESEEDEASTTVDAKAGEREGERAGERTRTAPKDGECRDSASTVSGGSYSMVLSGPSLADTDLKDEQERQHQPLQQL
ncbi:probable folate-biopterin transporter 6 [Cyclospora cayetanensis]|nr:probable folate-biopterin transporter 6 [Cyclospora cayetanensis]